MQAPALDLTIHRSGTNLMHHRRIYMRDHFRGVVCQTRYILQLHACQLLLAYVTVVHVDDSRENIHRTDDVT